MNHRAELPAVSVVIAARNEAEDLPAALASVMAQDYGGVIEIIVADGSDRPCRMADAVQKPFPDVQIVPNPARNTPAGLSRAIAAASHDILVRCDARSRLPPDYVRVAVSTLAHTGAEVVGGMQLPTGTTAFTRAVAMAMTTPLGAGDARYRIGGPEGPTDTVWLGVFRRKAVEAAGGFDGRFHRNQDYELNWRIRVGGGTVWFTPSLQAGYRPRDGFMPLARQYASWGRWKFMMLRRHPTSWRWRHLAAPLLTAALSSCAIAVMASFPLAAIVPLTYLLVLVVDAGITGIRRRDFSAVLLPPVLATMHLAWGFGFWFAFLWPKERIEDSGHSEDCGKSARSNYDCLLAAGPGRSGSTWLYRALADHPALCAPAIKEGFYYRSARRFERALKRTGQAVLLDVANLAWKDPALANLATLRDRGHRILIILLLRRHADRAASVIGYHRSRVLQSLFRSSQAFERAAVRDSLAPADLTRIRALGADVLIISFEALCDRPDAVLGVIAQITGVSPFQSQPPEPANQSVRARHPALAAAGKVAAVLLRAVGAHRLLQGLKDNPGVMDFFFRPVDEADRIRLGADTEACLDRRYRDCLAVLQENCKLLADGVWFCPGKGALPGDGRVS